MKKNENPADLEKSNKAVTRSKKYGQALQKSTLNKVKKQNVELKPLALRKDTTGRSEELIRGCLLTVNAEETFCCCCCQLVGIFGDMKHDCHYVIMKHDVMTSITWT